MLSLSKHLYEAAKKLTWNPEQKPWNTQDKTTAGVDIE